jgi:hypothetical protein
MARNRRLTLAGITPGWTLEVDELPIAFLNLNGDHRAIIHSVRIASAPFMFASVRHSSVSAREAGIMWTQNR